ncbi:MAG: SPOR domain-containing protein [Hyphomicrobiaceae bacterium]
MAWLWLRLALLALPFVALPIGSLALAQTVTPEAAPDAQDAQTAKARKARDPADAQQALDAAAKSLDAGKAEQAVQQINSLLSGPKLDVRIMARAMVLRGSAWRKQGKPAQAIADLTSALWLKGGLSEADRAAALAMRTEAYREAGLADASPTEPKASAGKRAETGSAAVPSSGQVEEAKPAPRAEKTAAPAASAQKSSGVSGFFSNLFGGGASSDSAAESAPEAAEREKRKASAPQPAIGTSWSNVTDVQSSAPKSRAETAPAIGAVTTTASTAASAGGRYRVQVASVRSRAEAQALASKVKAQHAAVLGARQLEIDETVIGNMGTFYRVRIGPYANAQEPGSLCAKLRGSGLDCLILAD